MFISALGMSILWRRGGRNYLTYGSLASRSRGLHATKEAVFVRTNLSIRDTTNVTFSNGSLWFRICLRQMPQNIWAQIECLHSCKTRMLIEFEIE